MATFYINGDNTTSGAVPPYYTTATGAPNFNTLMSYAGTSAVDDGDNIYIVPNTIPIYDNSATIVLNKSVIVYGDIDVPVYVNETTQGFIISSSDIELHDMHITIDVYAYTNIVEVGSSNFLMNNCTMDYTSATYPILPSGTSISMNGTSATISNCDISTANNGIFIDNSSHHIDVLNNVIDFKGDNGISTLGDNITMHENIITTSGGHTSFNSGINSTGDYQTITNNYIYAENDISPNNQVRGIVADSSSNGGIDARVLNNTILIGGTSATLIGAGIACAGYVVNTVTITDNIIQYISGDNMTGIRLSSDDNGTVVDYNDIYEFDTPFDPIGALTVMGDRTIFTDPHLVYLEDPTRYPDETNIRRYYCDTNSECVGAGTLYRTIGIGYQDEGHYVNIVDTVTDDLGSMFGSDGVVVNLFNSVFTDTAQEFNTDYRYNAGPYESSAVYKNQFEYIYEQTFPFEQSDHFYNKDFLYVLTNKVELEPFDGITCYPNPGRETPEYHPYSMVSSASPDYKQGLWGFDRVYVNGCTGLAKLTFSDTSVVYVQDPDADGILDYDNVILALDGVGKVYSDTSNIEIIEGAVALDFSVFDAYEGWFIGAPITPTQNLIIPSTLQTTEEYSVAGWSSSTYGVDLSNADSLQTIGIATFGWWEDANMLIDLVIPSNVTSIGEQAFTDWVLMSSGVDLSNADSLQTINPQAFWGWLVADMATDLVIPSNVTSIGADAFSGWQSMTQGITFMNVIPPTIGINSFTSWLAHASGIPVTVVGLGTVPADLSDYKLALTGSGTFVTINGVLWATIP